MTPEGWLTTEVVMLGAAWMFGGALVAVLVGAVVGRRKGVETGIGSGLTLWALGNLLIVVLMALVVHVDSVVLQLEPTRCEPGTDNRGHAVRTLYHTVQRPGEPVHELQGSTQRGLCPEGGSAREALRVRRDALASPKPGIPAEVVTGDDDTPLAVMVIWGMFGGIGLLMGGLLLAHGAGAGRPAPVRPPQATPAPWRVGLGNLLGQLGGLVFLAAFIAPWFLDGSTERALQLGMRCVAVSMGLWLVAGLVARTMHLGAAVFLLFFGSAMLGFGELLRRGS